MLVLLWPELKTDCDFFILATAVCSAALLVALALSVVVRLAADAFLAESVATGRSYVLRKGIVLRCGFFQVGVSCTAQSLK